MLGDNPNDAALKASWDDFCDQLKSAGDLVFRDTTPTQDIDSTHRDTGGAFPHCQDYDNKLK